MSPDGRITSVSPAVERMRGLTPEEAMNQPLDEILTPASAAISLGYWQELAARLEAGLPPQRFRGEYEYYCKDGSTVWTDVQMIPYVGANGQLIETLGVTRDISERKRHEAELLRARDETAAANQALQAATAELIRLATTDALTEARNRRHLEQVAETEMAAARRYGQPLSLLMCDIDHFKSVNDRHGHPAGDRVLVELAQRVRPHLRAPDVLARWGGDEFIIMLPHSTLADALQLAERLRELAASEPFPQVGTVTTSIGVADLQADESLDEWLERADQPLSEAKSGGRNTVRAALADEAAPSA
jgi:diguanylate cyclase (GGDEF)-like protein/PAS domain S-box-containing protein